MKPHDKLRQLREARDANEWHIAEVAGIGENTYWDLENFDSDLFNTVSLAEIGRIAPVLGLSMEELFASERPHIAGEAGGPRTSAPVCCQTRLDERQATRSL
jgi:hypothetical protein